MDRSNGIFYYVSFDGLTLKIRDVFFYYLQNFPQKNFHLSIRELWRWFWRETQNISNLNAIKSIFKEKFFTLDFNSVVCVAIVLVYLEQSEP